jgi:hypothetical protein
MPGAFRQIALLVSQTREWAKTHNVKTTELAEMLGDYTPRHNRNF